MVLRSFSLSDSMSCMTDLVVPWEVIAYRQSLYELLKSGEAVEQSGKFSCLNLLSYSFLPESEPSKNLGGTWWGVFLPMGLSSQNQTIFQKHFARLSMQKSCDDVRREELDCC